MFLHVIFSNVDSVGSKGYYGSEGGKKVVEKKLRFIFFASFYYFQFKTVVCGISFYVSYKIVMVRLANEQIFKIDFFFFKLLFLECLVTKQLLHLSMRGRGSRKFIPDNSCRVTCSNSRVSRRYKIASCRGEPGETGLRFLFPDIVASSTVR